MSGYSGMEFVEAVRKSDGDKVQELLRGHPASGLVNAKGIRGMGVWALGYDGGLPEMWSTLNTYFSCPASATVDATQATTEFSVSLSAGFPLT